MSESEATSFSVLVVEDDADTRDSLTEVLEKDGFAVQTASNGREAFEVLHTASTKPCVILLDMMMPVMDGWEFRNAQRNDPELASIPVALLSAQPNIEAAAKSVGAAAYIRKPLSVDNLIDTLDSLYLFVELNRILHRDRLGATAIDSQVPREAGFLRKQGP